MHCFWDILSFLNTLQRGQNSRGYESPALIVLFSNPTKNYLVVSFHFLFSPQFGEDEPNLTSIFFQMGWNHQPEKRLEESCALVERLLEDLLKSAESPTQLESLPKIPGVFQGLTRWVLVRGYSRWTLGVRGFKKNNTIFFWGVKWFLDDQLRITLFLDVKDH